MSEENKPTPQMNCSRVGCPNEGKHYPTLLIYGPAHMGTAPSLEMKWALPHCDAHQEVTTPADLLHDDQKREITKIFRAQKKAYPDYRMTRISWSTENVAVKMRDEVPS